MPAVWPLCEGIMSDHCLFLFISILKIISGQQGILTLYIILYIIKCVHVLIRFSIN